MPNIDQRPKVTLEDLLRLKRAERPSAEFWHRFESELRQKQLAALVDRRPWWHALPQFFTRRAYLPLGATAIVAVTLVSVRYYGSSQEVHAYVPVLAASHAAHLQPAALPPPSAVAVETRETEQAPVAEHAVASLSERLPDRAAELTPWSAPRTEESPSAKSIAASIARLELNEPDLATAALGGSRPATASRLQTGGSPATVELAAVSTLASRRSRLLAQLDDRRFTPEPQAPELVRERLAQRLADTDFNDRFSRVGIERGGVSLKF
jgi:hypothetical protein